MTTNRRLFLFQGDSITDAGRDRSDKYNLGCGYAYITAARIASEYPDAKLQFVNRGIGGDRTADLLRRWTEDCVELQPTWLSIMIGINDCWRRYDQNNPTAVSAYESNLRAIIERTRHDTQAQLYLIEPFLLPVSDVQHGWREDLDPKLAVVARLASEYGLIYIRTDTELNDSSRVLGARYWAEDGVHLTVAGHGYLAGLLVDAWIKHHIGID